MSPIHDQSYRRYAGERRPVGHAWRVIASDGIRQMLAKRAFLALLLVAWIPVIVRLVQMYFATSVPQAAGFLSITADTYRDFLEQQSVFVFFMTIYVGAGLIANDRRANALQIYLSKPMLRAEYVGGKLLVLATFLLCVTLVPGWLLEQDVLTDAGMLVLHKGQRLSEAAITALNNLLKLGKIADGVRVQPL